MNSETTESQGVDRLVKALTTGNMGGTTINLSAPITITANGDRAVAQKTGDSVLSTLNRVVGQVEVIAKSKR